jgi:hypothetical protein
MAAQGVIAAPRRVYGVAAEVKAATVLAFMAGKAVLHEPGYATADRSGRCERPIVIDRIGASHVVVSKPIHGAEATPQGFVREEPFTLSTRVRCRRCEACLRERRWMWTERAVREYQAAAQAGARTWFVTLTFKPSEHYKLQTKTRLRVASYGINLDEMKPRERLEEVMKEYKQVMSLYVNRLRVGVKSRGWETTKFRYLWVPEPHKNGEIHFHMLLHEVSKDKRIVKDRIKEMWGIGGNSFGFTRTKLLDTEGGARYATKYLGKHHFEGRLAVSMHYGDPPEDEEAKLATTPIPGHQSGRPYEASGREAQDIQELMEHLGVLPRPGIGDPGDGEDDPGACPTGLHFGMRCSCKPPDGDPDPWGTASDDALTASGVARRKWRLRGWNVPQDRRGRPRLKEPAH